MFSLQLLSLKFKKFNFDVVALREGQKLAWSKGLHSLKCNIDSQVVIDFIKKGVGPYHLYACIVKEIKEKEINELLTGDWLVSLHHTYREGNQCADYLAKKGARQQEHVGACGDSTSSQRAYKAYFLCNTNIAFFMYARYQGRIVSNMNTEAAKSVLLTSLHLIFFFFAANY